MRLTTFIYCLKESHTDKIRYVGKADNPKDRLRRHIQDKRDSHKTRWIVNLLQQGHKPILEILDEVPYIGWEEFEKSYILVFRAIGFNLTNTSDGGEAPMEGRKHSKETLIKLRDSHIGQHVSAETREKHRNQMLGNTFRLGHSPSEETRKKLSLANIKYHANKR